MPWVRLDDRFPSHRKVALLSDRAFRLHVSALCWSSENLTEGRIAERELPFIARIRRVKAVADELVDARLWERADDDGYVIHDYLEYNPDRAKVKAERAANAARQQAFRDRKRAEREAAQKQERNAQRNGVTGNTEGPSARTSEARTRHEVDTNSVEKRPEKTREPQVTELRNAVSNGTPAPAPTPSTSYGSTAAAGEHALPDPLADLKRSVAAAGLSGIAWDLRESGWEYTRQAVDRVGVAAMVAYAVNSARLKGPPAGASAWVQGWRSLEATPEQDGVAYLPAVAGGFPPATSRQQQETDDWADRAMARARARDAQGGTA